MSVLPSPSLGDQSGWFHAERGAKARFKAFFTRSKSERIVPQHPEPRPCPPSTLTVAKRGRSTTWSNRMRDSQQGGKPQRPKNMTSWDPPPLIQAYTQAKMHAILDIPSTLTETIFGSNQRRNSISGESSSRPSLEDHLSADDPGLNHKRNCSGASVCSLSQKLFILGQSGCILQYSADGLNDRLPEKMLELGPDSVAFASDDIPGKHWVLRVLYDGVSDRSASHNSRNTWSKLAFKHAEDKKLVKDLLLVFDNAVSLGLWLTAIRKEIEMLGGLRYRPDSRGPAEDEAKSKAVRPLRTRRSLPVFSRSEDKVSGNESTSAVLLPPMPQRPASRKISRSTTDSSIHTLTDLDNIRDASFSDDRSISTAHTSFTSTTSTSRLVESFSSVEYEPPTTRDAQSRVSTPTQEDLGELSMYMATPKRNPTRSVPPRTTSMDAQTDAINHDLFVPTRESNHQAAVAWESRSRPISTIAPLPEPGHIRKISARYRYEPQVLPAQPMTPVSRPGSLRSRSSSYTQDSPDGVQKRTASYSLFPKTPSYDQSQLAQQTGLPSPPVTTPGSVLASMCDVPESSEPLSGSRPSSQGSQRASKRLGKALSIDTKKTEAATGLIVQSQRSPAVTAAHLETCFGAHPDAPRRKSCSKSSFSTITTTTVDASTGVSSQVVHLANPPRKHRHVKGQKSMPSLVHRTMPPSGPPPTGPLPALPKEACFPIQKAKLSSVSCGMPPRPQLKHTKAESAGPWLPSTDPVALKTAQSQPATAHKRNVSSVSSVASVRHITTWLQSDRVAAFTAKCETAPTLHVDVPESPAFSCGFDKILS
ncbi:hypothetical protein A1O1_06690 [Capronia coronata CBS 617.96]|uniref:Uncharacterized protein n=1 Tax=Capronia coronata CBS 617.96 TaxID=1182541 RepID=W9XR93_9EURO|nr:uncharacterized protein A1O1_06690 [Capronia coronata CBS 617.96]EXJ83072.1 hypothetical protein A1O1_06690 [Capronia coronata CBS 617.96]